MTRAYTYRKQWLKRLIPLLDRLGEVVWGRGKEGTSCRVDPPTVRRIGILKYDHLGDVLLATPALQALREQFPRAEITVVVSTAGQEVLRGNPHLNHLRLYDAPWLTRPRWRRGWVTSTYRLVRALRQARFGICLVLREDLFGNVLARLSGAPIRVGYGNAGGGFLLTHVFWINDAKPQREVLLDAARLVGVERASTSIHLPVDEDARYAADSFLRKHSLPQDQPLLGLHPGAGRPEKRWPIEYFIRLIARLREKQSVGVLVVGGPEEVSLAQQLVEHVPSPVINTCGEANLSTTIALIERCVFFLGADSAPAHIAGALGLPTVVLFSGYDDPRRWAPQGPQVTILTPPGPCPRCGGKGSCGHQELMATMELETVLEALLSHRPAGITLDHAVKESNI